MPARKPPPPDERPQRDRFIETARQIGASEDPKEFERAFEKAMGRPAPSARVKPEKRRARDN
jgi:hypothetical protein